MEDLAGLPTAFDKDGFVTAGNASGIVDGAAMMILTTAQKAQEQGWKPLGRILSWATVGVDPVAHGHRPGAGHPGGARQGGHGARRTSTCSRSTRRSPARSWRSSRSWTSTSTS